MLDPCSTLVFHCKIFLTLVICVCCVAYNSCKAIISIMERRLKFLSMTGAAMNTSGTVHLFANPSQRGQVCYIEHC